MSINLSSNNSNMKELKINSSKVGSVSNSNGS
jgi:hypothetical protein